MSKKQPRRDHDREERITMEIIVDAYNESEVWTGWYCYLRSRMREIPQDVPAETR